MTEPKDRDLTSGMFGVQGTGDTSGYGGLVRTTVNPGSTERPYGGYFDQVADDLERAYPDFADAITKVVVDRGELTLHIKKERLVKLLQSFATSCSLKCAWVFLVFIIQSAPVANSLRSTHCFQ